VGKSPQKVRNFTALVCELELVIEIAEATVYVNAKSPACLEFATASLAILRTPAPAEIELGAPLDLGVFR
jgi:hypothetical protein